MAGMRVGARAFAVPAGRAPTGGNRTPPTGTGSAPPGGPLRPGMPAHGTAWGLPKGGAAGEAGEAEEACGLGEFGELGKFDGLDGLGRLGESAGRFRGRPRRVTPDPAVQRGTVPP